MDLQRIRPTGLLCTTRAVQSADSLWGDRTTFSNWENVYPTDFCRRYIWSAVAAVALTSSDFVVHTSKLLSDSPSDEVLLLGDSLQYLPGSSPFAINLGAAIERPLLEAYEKAPWAEKLDDELTAGALFAMATELVHDLSLAHFTRLPLVLAPFERKALSAVLKEEWSTTVSIPNVFTLINRSVAERNELPRAIGDFAATGEAGQMRDVISHCIDRAWNKVEPDASARSSLDDLATRLSLAADRLDIQLAIGSAPRFPNWRHDLLTLSLGASTTEVEEPIERVFKIRLEPVRAALEQLLV